MNKRGQTAGTASPTTAPGKKKLLLIGIIVAAIVLIIVLFFVGRQFGLVGKAIAFTPPPGFVAGAEIPLEVPLKAGEIATIRVGAVVPENQESVAWEFSLNYDAARFKLVDVDSKLLEDWGADLLKVTKDATAGTLKVEHGTLDYTKALKGAAGGTAYRLAEVNFEALQDITTEGALASFIAFNYVSLWSLSDTPVDLIPDGTQFSQPSGVAKCVASDGLCGGFCADAENRPTYCDYSNQCTILFPCVQQGGYNADLTLDGKYDGQDAQVIFGTRDARNDNNCGGIGTSAGTGQQPCNYYKLLYVCDDGSFRVQGLDIYNGGVAYSHGSQTCSYTMEANVGG